MKVLKKDYNSVSGSNQVQNLNPHPPIGMDTLDENEVDICEVQVGLCDNMIGTNSAIWESYESYHSKDDTFTWESVEMNNELFDIPKQRDAPTKDCKGKGKVDYNSSSRKLKTKGSGWFEESCTSEELDVVYPVRNQSDWKTSKDYVHMTILPPKVVKRVGRPKKKRIPNVGEALKLHKMVVLSDKYFPTTVSCQVHKIDSLIKDKLIKQQLQMFDKTIFGPLLNVNMVFNGQLIHHFLLRQIPEDETVMVEKDKKTQFDMDILGRVDDEEAFKSFDWSTFFYTRLLNSLKTSLQGKKEAYELKKTTSSKAVSYCNIKGYVLALQHLATRNSKGLIPRILRWNCTQAPSYKMLQKYIFDNKNDSESIGAMNNKSLEQSDSSPQLSPQREQNQTVADQSEMLPITNKKRCRSKKSNDKEEQSHSKSYKKLKKEIKEVRKDLSTLTSIVCRMDDTITKQSLELEHQQESGSDISIDGRDADLLMTIRDISDNQIAKSQKEKDLPQMITTLPLVSQPLALCEMAPLDQTIQIVNEESQLVEIQKNDEAVTLVEKEPVIVPDKDEQEKPIKRRKLCKIANKKVPDEDEQGNSPTTSTKIISESTIPVPDLEIREVDRYNPMWQVDPKL
ncbi:MuDRA-like transposase [Cucumis melo var. makuwa]|uniref:MuDRA-like transposase n=1 Tax=Cucumis melo var. makuwa TaxID=1194695 RepID=A0A5D3DZC8_CUCMM|nr:MuDRA-like transposase [Cucumis melo var. makuwa]